MNAYPPKPEQATLYYHHYGYEIPVALGAWEWSVDFGRWGRIVTFADGWHGYTFPSWNRLRRIFTITHEHRKAARRISSKSSSNASRRSAGTRMCPRASVLNISNLPFVDVIDTHPLRYTSLGASGAPPDAYNISCAKSIQSKPGVSIDALDAREQIAPPRQPTIFKESATVLFTQDPQSPTAIGVIIAENSFVTSKRLYFVVTCSGIHIFAHRYLNYKTSCHRLYLTTIANQGSRISKRHSRPVFGNRCTQRAFQLFDLRIFLLTAGLNILGRRS